MATLAEHERATSDLNLMRRVISASQIERIPNSQSGVQENLAEIVSTKIDVFETETTLTNLLTLRLQDLSQVKIQNQDQMLLRLPTKQYLPLFGLFEIHKHNRQKQLNH